MVKYASERMNASYLDWWRRPGFLDMVLPSRLRHVLDEGGGYIGGGGKDDVPLLVEDMARGGDFPLPADLIVGSIIACIVMSVIRLVIDKVLVRMTQAYDSKHKLAAKTIKWREEHGERGGVEKLQQLCETRIRKYSECCWRFLLYLAMTAYGTTCIRRSILFMDVNEVFSVWPFDVLEQPIRLFYYLETGLYIHLTINHFFEVYRKDFAVMLLHHVATMGLLAWSWLFNFTRWGILVMILHDVSDVVLEASKLCQYMQLEVAKDCGFVIFALTFFVTRLVMFPLYILKPAMFESYPVWGNLVLRYVLIALLGVLQLMHVWWFSIIVKMVVMFARGEMEGDERSDDDMDEQKEVEERNGDKKED